MPQEVRAIPLLGVNCYLVGARNGGSVLVDTGYSFSRRRLGKVLQAAGCRPGDLKLIVITHGDFDHIGNAAHLRSKYGCRIAMHRDDAGMAERGDMFWSRRRPPLLVRALVTLFFRLRKGDRFAPDICLEGGEDLSEYGFAARTVCIPGHSRGSTAYLTSGGALFCGDLLRNTGRPGLHTLMDDRPTAIASVEKLRALDVKTVYPGHGRPFTMAELTG